MNIFFTKIAKRTTPGFTLVETLVSTMIITLVILGPLTLASNASSYAKMTKDTLIATYLAQEAIELLRFQQDSVYIRCIQGSGSGCPTTSNEIPQEAAWRIFKERLDANPQGVSCFGPNENAHRCAYDYIDMTTNISAPPTRYNPGDSTCYTLSIENATGLYVCSGAHGSGPEYTLSNFSRWVFINDFDTTNGVDKEYHDDLRVTVTVTFKRANGYTREIKVVDFLHARS